MVVPVNIASLCSSPLILPLDLPNQLLTASSLLPHSGVVTLIAVKGKGKKTTLAASSCEGTLFVWQSRVMQRAV